MPITTASFNLIPTAGAEAEEIDVAVDFRPDTDRGELSITSRAEAILAPLRFQGGNVHNTLWEIVDVIVVLRGGQMKFTNLKRRKST